MIVIACHCRRHCADGVNRFWEKKMKFFEMWKQAAEFFEFFASNGQ